MSGDIQKGKHGFWEFKKYKEHEWFQFLILLISLLGAVYLVSHFFLDKVKGYYGHEKAGYEYERLDARQLQHINSIYFDTLNIGQPDRELEAESQETPLPDSATVVQPQPDKGSSAQPLKFNKCLRVLFYIQQQFNYKVDKAQIDSLRPYLCSARPLEVISFLGTVRLRVQSYFWLTGPEVYFEIIFWSWFGVICSILFNLGMVAKNVTTVANNPHTRFDSSEIPHQVAKLVYAPLCTLIIVLGYNYFSDQNIVDISSSKGLIVFAFIGGFYSARLIAFLDRLKEVVLPSSSSPELPVQKPADIKLQDITIELGLDETSVPAELISDIAEMGFNDAIVSLEHAETGEIKTAVPTTEDQASTFLVGELRPGEYIISASWSKEINGEPVNLEASLTQKILSSDMNIVVLLKKAADEG